MEFWLREVATEWRNGEKLIHVASRANVSEGTISRFEAGKSWPRDLDQLLDAYASTRGCQAIDIWSEALYRWRQAQTKESTDPDQRERDAQALEEAAEEEARRRRERSSSSDASEQAGDGQEKRP